MPCVNRSGCESRRKSSEKVFCDGDEESRRELSLLVSLLTRWPRIHLVTHSQKRKPERMAHTLKTLREANIEREKRRQTPDSKGRERGPKASRLGFLFDVNLEFGSDVAKDLDGDGVFAKGLDGIGELDLALVNLEALCLQPIGDVAGGDGAEHLIVFAGLAVELQGNAIEQLGLLFRGLEFGGGLFGESGADAFKRLHVARSGFDGKLVGQEKIAGVAWLDGDNVAAVAELFDIFLKNDLHDDLLTPFRNFLRAKEGLLTSRTAFGTTDYGSKSGRPKRSTNTRTGMAVAVPAPGCYVLGASATGRGAWVPAALPANGNRAMLRARLM